MIYALPCHQDLYIKATTTYYYLLVNGRPVSSFQGRPRSSPEEQPFIVVAAAAAPDNEQESFIPTAAAGDSGSVFKLLTQDDLAREEFVVVEASGVEAGRTLIPTDDSSPNKPGFKLLTKADLAREQAEDAFVVIEADEEGRSLFKDVPRDKSGRDQAGFRLPLLPDEGLEDEYDDVFIVEVGDEEEEGRTLSAIPRDESRPGQAGFRLPLPVDEYDDFEIIEAGSDDDEEEGRSIAAIPSDESRPDQAGFRLPKTLDYDDFDIVVIGIEDEVDCFAERESGTCLNSYRSWFYDPNHNKCHFFLYSGCGGNTNRQVLY
jgi:hypothetical protein